MIGRGQAAEHELVRVQSGGARELNQRELADGQERAANVHDVRAVVVERRHVDHRRGRIAQQLRIELKFVRARAGVER